MATGEASGWRQAGELGDVGLRFALLLALAVWGGWKLDQRWGWTPWLTLTGTALGLALGATWSFFKLRDLINREPK
jgi:dolichyl-phosphate-mannose--protein O-mannosyl transferase